MTEIKLNFKNEMAF